MGYRETAEIALDYLKTREQFGKPSVPFKLYNTERLICIYSRTTDAVTEESAKLWIRLIVKSQNLAVTRAKYRSNEASIAISRQAVQLHGGMGYMKSVMSACI